MPANMTPERLRECLDILGMTDAQLIRALDADPRTVQRWQSGARNIPNVVADWLERLAAHWQANPPPIMRGRARDPETLG